MRGSFKRLCSLHEAEIFRCEPIDLEAAPSIIFGQGPVDKFKTPIGNDVFEVFDLLDVLHAVMQGAATGLIPIFIIEAMLFQGLEEPPLEPTFGVGIVFCDDVTNSHRDAHPKTKDSPKGAARIVGGGVEVSAEQGG